VTTVKRVLGGGKMSFLSTGDDLFTFCWNENEVSVLNIWTGSGLASKHCTSPFFSQFLALLFVLLMRLCLLWWQIYAPM